MLQPSAATVTADRGIRRIRNDCSCWSAIRRRVSMKLAFANLFQDACSGCQTPSLATPYPLAHERAQSRASHCGLPPDEEICGMFPGIF